MRFAIGVVCYLVFGFGGYLAAVAWIKDDVLFELFISVWWLPAGGLSYLAAMASTSMINGATASSNSRT